MRTVFFSASIWIACGCASGCSKDSSSSPDNDAGGAAIDGGGTISASNYNQACTTATDCVTIVEGDVCDPCACPTVAITASAQDSYDVDFNALRATCPPSSALSCGGCPSVAPACTGGKCTVVPCTDPSGCAPDSGSDADGSSDANDDAD